MASINPFNGYRPTKALAKQVASKPYDVLNTEEARIEAEGNPNSFLHIIRSEIDFPKGADVYNPAIYERARENFENMVCQNVVVQDETPCLYVYRIFMGNHSQTGLVCGASVDDYFNNEFSPIEWTLFIPKLQRAPIIKFLIFSIGIASTDGSKTKLITPPSSFRSSNSQLIS